jgi:integral membrane protein (TIGR00529 family)
MFYFYIILSMQSTIILLGALVVLGILVKLKVNIGVSIFASALFIVLFKHFTLIQLGNTLLLTLIDRQTVEIIFIVIVITYFADLLKVSGFLEEMIESFSAFLSPKSFIPLFAFIIGSLPMPGGALVSAPLVEKGSEHASLGAEQKTVINFWFRHIWEPTSPLYPEMILASSILEVSILRIISIQWPFTLLMFISGILFLIPLIKTDNHKKLDKSLKAFNEMMLSLIPILIVLLLILIFHVPIIISGLIGIIYIVIVKKVNFQKIKKALNVKLLLKLAFLMYAIFFLKFVVMKSNIINDVYLFMKNANVPSFIILFSLPFIVSLMTGAASATVGVSYPLLLPLLKTPNLNPIALFIAFLGGWTALMFTPTHLCLSLTVEYFNAKLNKTYPLLFKNIAFLFTFSVLYIFLLKFI